MDNQVIQHLHMNGGTGVTSYSSNSFVQKKVINMTRPLVEEAILHILSKFCTATTTTTTISPNNKLSIADLGCSSGPNTFLLVSNILNTTYNKCHEKSGGVPPEILVFLNDLPGNDFNTIFKSLESFSNEMRESKGNGLGAYFVAGMPGTFYGRLFPTHTLHFVHSSYSLHWLSQVPPGIGKKNKGNICISKSSPASVIEAYIKQFERDFNVFLRCRSEELVEGGRMVLTVLGRRSSDYTSKEYYYLWELLAMALNDMVSQGMIEEEKLELFNMPFYFPCPEEVKSVIDTEGSFIVNQIKTFESNADGSEDGGDSTIDKSRSSFNMVNSIRPVSESLLAIHFGDEILDELFHKHRKIVIDRMTREKTTYTNVVVSVTKG